MNVRPLEQLTCTHFAELVNTKFRVWTDLDAQDSLDLELTEVTSPRIIVAGGVKSAAHEHFSLHFRGPAGRLLPQRIYCFESPALGRFELYIAPAGYDLTASYYQATFNRIVRPA